MIVWFFFRWYELRACGRVDRRSFVVVVVVICSGALNMTTTKLEIECSGHTDDRTLGHSHSMELCGSGYTICNV